MDVSELSGKVPAHRMLEAFRLAPPEQLTFLIQNGRGIMRTALPRRQWAGKQKHQMIGLKEISARWSLRWVPSRQFEVHLPTLAIRPSSLRPLSLMKFITKRQHTKPVADSNPWAVRRKKTKQPKFKDKDLNRMSEFDDMFGLVHYDTGWNASYGTSAYIEDKDDTSSISSFSTNATMDNIPGTGRTLDMCFYQPVGRAIEKFALKIAIRLNICHPSPAQILRFFRLFDLYNILSVHGRRTLLIVTTFTIYSARTLDYHCSLR